MFVVDADCHPQTIDVVRTRAEPLGIEVVVARSARRRRRADGCFGVLAAVPGRERPRARPRAGRSSARTRAARSCASRPTCSRCTLLAPPGEMGADVVVGTSQRFGVPLGFGGPHAAYIATRDEYQRTLPGRLVGVSVDARRPHRVPARAADARAAHPAREGDEQHLHRAGAARGDRRPVRVVPRPRGLARDRDAGAPAHGALADALARRRRRGRARRVLRHDHGARARPRRRGIAAAARARRINLRRVDADTRRHRARRDDDRRRSSAPCCAAFGVDRRRSSADADDAIPRGAARARRSSSRTRCSRRTAPRPDAALPAPARRPRPRARPHDDPARLVHDEAQRDHRDGADHVARVRSHPPVRAGRPGRAATSSCSPTSSAGSREITGYDAVSLQPNAGSQGEYAGLLAIRKYHAARGERAARRLPDPRVGARHERGVGRDGRHARRRRRVRRPRQRRPRRPRSARRTSTPTSSRR